MSKFIEANLYKSILKSIPIVCIDCVVQNFWNNGILLIKRNDKPAKDQWWIPGGRLYKGESLKDCAIRKCIEEVGLNCNIIRQLHTAETIFDDGPNNIPVHSVNTIFLMSINNSDSFCIPTLDEHSKEFIWIPKDSDLPLHNYIRDCLDRI